MLCGTVLLLGAAVPSHADESVARPNVDAIMLLLPDDTVPTDPNVTIWLDAASEEGLHLTVVPDAQFLDPAFDPTRYAGLILPDQVHPKASDDLVAAVKRYVGQGGQ